MIYLTSDLDLEDDDFYSNYNSLITNNDDVFFLGNIIGTKDIMSTYMSGLKGRKHLVLSKSDSYYEDFYLVDCGFKTINRYISTKKYAMVNDPWEFKNKDQMGCKILLHGKTNCSSPVIEFKTLTGLNGEYTWDVGVKANNYCPVSLSHIKKHFKRPYSRYRC